MMVEELAKSVDSIAGQFLSQGLLGSVCIVLFATSWRFFSLYQMAMEKRLSESRESIEAITQTRLALERLTDLLKNKEAIR